MKFKNRINAIFLLAVFLFSIFPLRIFCPASPSHIDSGISIYKTNSHSDCPVCSNHLYIEFETINHQFIGENIAYLRKINLKDYNSTIQFTFNFKNKSPPISIF